ncbi:unnamed protein product [Brassica oleracea]|uniref:(rape) hypothetical protein n=1 Tax=Brassica napus TaxID=3708 RepID=A0A816LI45_BRANA|nr:unnamed protein product [Brassica napus]
MTCCSSLPTLTMKFCYVVHAVARLSYMSLRQEKTLERSTLFANTLRKKEWDEAIEEETKKLTKKVADDELKIRSLYSIEDRLSRLEEDEKKNAEDIEELKYFLKNCYPNEFY